MKYGLEKCMENWLEWGMEAYRDLWYRIGTFSTGTFSMGGYGYAAAGLVSGEMLPLAL